MKKKFIASVLVLAMVVGSLAGCGKKDANTSGGKSSKNDTLVIGNNAMNREYSSMFYTSAYDKNVLDLIYSNLFCYDRAGMLVTDGSNGTTREYNGKKYEYKTAADMTVKQNKDASGKIVTTTYDIKMRDDIVFSDGEKATIDDIIFQWYVTADTSYDGMSTFASLPIVGMENYRYNSTITSSVTDKEVANYLAKALKTNKDLQAKVVEIMKAGVQAEIAEIESGLQAPDVYADYTKTYKKPLKDCKDVVEVIANNYVPNGKTIDTTKSTKDTIADDLVALYGTDYQALSKALVINSGGVEGLFDGDILSEAKAALLKEKVAKGEGKEVPNIEGIKKINDYEVQVTTEGFDVTTEMSLDCSIEPMHYFGDKSQYDYENNKFGFTRGNVKSVKDKIGEPKVCSGPYIFEKYENKIAYLKVNPKYYKGEPKIKKIQLKESQDKDLIPGVQKGTIDMAADISGSKDTLEQIKGLNSNKKETGNVLTTVTTLNNGYGYLGIDSERVNVGGKKDSDQSKALRKGLMTIFGVYREKAISSYYGDAASVIQYPISNTSWAAPKQSDPEYKNAFSVDATGKDIYSDSMSDADKEKAAITAALSFFKQAGCTVSGDKVTKAPAGLKLDFEVTIGGSGQGEHPAFAVITDAAATLKKMGVNIRINDMSDAAAMFDKVDNGEADIFVMAWGDAKDPDMYQIYHSSSIGASNKYKIADKKLDALIVKARLSDNKEYRKTVYKQCLDIVLDWAVELPLYQRDNVSIYSTERIKVDTLPKDITTFYKWSDEIENLELK